MLELIHRRRQGVRLIGLALLVVGLAVALAFDVVAGLAMIAASAVPLTLVQPQILARVRSHSVRKVAPSNGHSPGTHSEDLDIDD